MAMVIIFFIIMIIVMIKNIPKERLDHLAKVFLIILVRAVGVLVNVYEKLIDSATNKPRFE